ncbi:transposase [Streptomyces aurantiacus]|uniref:transposase n=1 Tax=Streptomyces aurantiacus TaxID=47760 RepID=UPI001BD2203E|nr:transposase [Streptomyces aurantiacus]
MFTAVVYVLTSGCAWRHLPETFGVSPATAHRRFTAWIRAGPWRRLHRAVLDELGARGELDRASAIVDAASVRAERGTLTGPNPVDRGKKGSKLHVVSEAQGIPLAVAVLKPPILLTLRADSGQRIQEKTGEDDARCHTGRDRAAGPQCRRLPEHRIQDA